MKNKLIRSNDGLSLIELLAALAIVGTITILVVNYLLGGMDSYQNVSDNVSMNNEANYIITVFTNEIFVATEAEEIQPVEEGESLIKLSNLDNEEVIIGFKDNKAVKIKDGETQNLSSIRFPCGGSLRVKDDVVQITVVIEDDEAENDRVKLQSQVSIGKETNDAKEGGNHEDE